MINQAMVLRVTSPATRLTRYLRKPHASVRYCCCSQSRSVGFKDLSARVFSKRKLSYATILQKHVSYFCSYQEVGDSSIEWWICKEKVEPCSFHTVKQWQLDLEAGIPRALRRMYSAVQRWGVSFSWGNSSRFSGPSGSSGESDSCGEDAWNSPWHATASISDNWKRNRGFLERYSPIPLHRLYVQRFSYLRFWLHRANPNILR